MVQAYSPLLQILNRAIEQQSSLFALQAPQTMYEPMGYILSLGGKRVRPLLTLIACDLFNQDVQGAIPSAMAIELFHNFSLIHDDVLDNAPLRRGHSTVHQKWNQNIAILSGDGMLVKAYEVLATSNKEHVTPLLQLFAKTGMEVCEGQQMDMDFETKDMVSVEDYIQMITYKTAVLLACSLQMGAICANANPNSQQHLYEFGKHVGIAFQLLDDVLDVYAIDKKFGKQIGGDIISNKKTFLLLKALELSNTEQLQELKELLTNASFVADEKINKVIYLYNQLGVKDLALKEADKHTAIALKHIDEIDVDITKKNNLKTFALQLLNREI